MDHDGPFERITSLQNTKVKQARKLREKRQRERDGRFVIEYSRDLERALDQGFTVDYALYAPQLADEDDNNIRSRLPASHVFEVTPEIMQKASYRQNPNGLLAVMISRPLRDVTWLAEQAPALILVLVDLKKPGNIGALLRTADAAGIDAIVLVDTALDLFNPNIIRSSTGACFINNVVVAASEDALSFFQSTGYTTVATVVDGSRLLFEADFTGKTAILLGTEDQGLPDFWVDQTNQQVRIPMMGQLSDSLNVSVSGAIFMYEALRQRAALDFET